jgi:hypothetical protein
METVLLKRRGKSEEKRFTLAHNPSINPFYKHYKKDFDYLFQHFDPQENPPTMFCNIARSTLTDSLNKLLQKAATNFGNPKWSSHSCRISALGKIVETGTVEQAQGYAGHANISTTMLYTRNKYNVQQMAKIGESAAPEFFTSEQVDSHYQTQNSVPKKRGSYNTTLKITPLSSEEESEEAEGSQEAEQENEEAEAEEQDLFAEAEEQENGEAEQENGEAEP